jgi:hypothetical protein
LFISMPPLAAKRLNVRSIFKLSLERKFGQESPLALQRAGVRQENGTPEGSECFFPRLESSRKSFKNMYQHEISFFASSPGLR